MSNNKLIGWKISEKLGLVVIILFILLHAIYRQDSIIAVISAICGILYTFIAGKGLPICYLFGLMGSLFYIILSYQNSLWGNLLLYACYYIPMQILGFIKWNQNLKKENSVIVKISLPKKDMQQLLLITLITVAIMIYLLLQANDAHPVLDSITTVLSLAGMYLTVRRAIEQWVFWFVVNGLSLAMWVFVALSGARVYSTIMMWAVYLFLAIYFYFQWKKELQARF